jgi:hypothetical protein
MHFDEGCRIHPDVQPALYREHRRLGPFIEVFKSSEYQDISLAEWMAHTPHLLMNQHLGVTMSMLDSIPKEEAVVTPL